MSNFDAGTIEARLILDRTEFNGDLDAAEARAKEFEAKPIVKRVKVDDTTSGGLLAWLNDVDKQAEKTGEELDKTADKTENLGKKSKEAADYGISPMLDAILLLGPAIAPLAGATLTLGAGLIGMGATGVLAFKGISAEIQHGTDLGIQYRAGLGVLQGDLASLEHQAASGVLGAFHTTIQQVNGEMPRLHTNVGILSTDLGFATQNLVGGLIGGFNTFIPLIQHGSVYIDTMAAGFERWATGPGGANFASALGHDFDVAMPFLQNLVSLATKLIAGYNSAGLTIISMLNGLVGALNSIPLPVLTALETFFTLGYGAYKVSGLIDGTATSIGNLTTKLGGANTKLGGMAEGIGSMAGKAGALGAIVIATAGAVQATESYIDRNNSEVKAVNNSKQAVQDLTTALEASRGAVDGNVQSSLQYQLGQDGITSKAAAAGISVDQLTSAITSQKDFSKATTDSLSYLVDQYNSGKISSDQFYAALDKQGGLAMSASDKAMYYSGSLQEVIDKWKASGKPADSTIQALVALNQQYADAKAASDKYLASQEKYANQAPAVWGSLQANATSLQVVSDKYGLTVSQARKYAAVLGIQADDIKNGTVTNQQLASAVGTVSRAFATANQDTTQYLKAIDAFSTSAHTAADRATIIGETLRAANGDSLAYATTMVTSAKANQDFINSVDSSAKAAKETTKQYLGSIIDLKTGTIDYNNAAADPLVKALDSIQKASMDAASATYQHNVALHGTGEAADMAYQVYVSRTQGALIDEARHLGLTKDQAQRLSDTYFGMPKDVKTQIEALGTDPVQKILNTIEQTLLYIAGLAPKPTIAVNDQATAALASVREKLVNLNGSTAYVQVQEITSHGGSGGRALLPATGGLISGPGTGTSDSIPAHLSNGEYVIKADAVNQYGVGFFDAINGGAVRHNYATGGLVTPGNPFTGVKYAPEGGAAGGRGGRGRGSGRTAATTAAAHAAAAAARAAAAAARALQQHTADLNRFGQAALSFNGGRIQQTGHQLALDSLRTHGGGSYALELQAETTQLTNLAQRRLVVANQLKWANANLASVQAAWHNEQQRASAAVMGTFNAATAGNQSMAGFLAELSQRDQEAAQFKASLDKMRASGLNQSLVNQIALAGPQSGGYNASMLSHATKAQIAQINAGYAQLGKDANAVGTSSANAMYGAGVNMAQGLVNGLKSQEQQISLTMLHIASSMVAQFKKEMGIRSPSTVWAEIGMYNMQGLDQGHAAGAGAVTRNLAIHAQRMTGTMASARWAHATPTAANTNADLVAEIRALRAELQAHGDQVASDVVEGVGRKLDSAVHKQSMLAQTREVQAGGRRTT